MKIVECPAERKGLAPFLALADPQKSQLQELLRFCLNATIVIVPMVEKQTIAGEVNSSVTKKK